MSWSPVLITHKFHGLSIDDLCGDLQQIRSVLLRGILDNMYIANNQRMAVDERVNLDDVLLSGPGAPIRIAGSDGPGNHIMPIPGTPVPDQVYTLLEYLDGERKGRVGVSDETAGLDPKALSTVNTGVAMLAFDSARMKVELIARICSEVCLRPCYRMIHALLRKHCDKKMTVKLRGKYVPVDPSTWRERTDMTVMVGLGQASRERRLMALDAVTADHTALMEQGGAQVVTPKELYEARIDRAEALGLRNASKYYKLQPPPPPQPDPQMEAIKMQGQAMMLEAQAKKEANQVTLKKIQSEERVRGLRGSAGRAGHTAQGSDRAHEGRADHDEGRLRRCRRGRQAHPGRAHRDPAAGPEEPAGRGSHRDAAVPGGPEGVDRA